MKKIWELAKEVSDIGGSMDYIEKDGDREALRCQIERLKLAVEDLEKGLAREEQHG